VLNVVVIFGRRPFSAPANLIFLLEE